MSSDAGALYKLRPYIPQSALLAVYYSLVYSHLVYSIICWGNSTKTSLSKLQVKQNRIIKLICNNSYHRTKLKPLYEKLQALNVKGIYSLEVAKFMVKVHLNKLPKLSNEYLIDLKKCSSIHSYSTRNAVSSNLYVQRTSLAKTNQSLRVSGVKIWNALPEHIKEKTLTSSGNVFSKVSKKYLLLYVVMKQLCNYHNFFYYCCFICFSGFCFVFLVFYMFFWFSIFFCFLFC